MPKIYSYTCRIEADVLDAFCCLQRGFTDQFVYYDKERPVRLLGLGRCIALHSLHEVEEELQGCVEQSPVFFSFNRFDAENPKPTDDLFASFPRLLFLLPEIVLLQVEGENGAIETLLQVNSLGPVYAGRVNRFTRQTEQAPKRERRDIPVALELDDRGEWNERIAAGLAAIESGRVGKVVLSRRCRVQAESPFSSKDLLVNLIDGGARGVVFMYRYGDVFFCGCTPELLVRKQGRTVQVDCLAGTCPAGADEAERERLAQELLADPKNRAEHQYVVDFITQVLGRNCYDVQVPAGPVIRSLQHVQHLHTPVSAQVMDGRSLENIANQLHPTPALAGEPVGEACMLIRQIEPYNRGFYGGSVGYVDARGNGAFSVGIRSGVFDGEMGWLYAGCGIVAGSDADSEYDEIELKLQTILSAFDGGCHA